MTEDLARKYGVPFFRSAVGEANVVDVMLAKQAVIGGEGNGGVIDPRVGLVRDSFVGMALVLDAMAARELPVSALADELPRYAIHKTKIDLAPEKIPAAYSRPGEALSRRQVRPPRRPAARLAPTPTAAAAGSSCARATPSRSCGSSPKRRPPRRRRRLCDGVGAPRSNRAAIKYAVADGSRLNAC